MKAHKICLHVGCGKHKIVGGGWFNIDVRPEVNPDIVTSAVHLEMFEDESVDLVYACHVLEHLTPTEGARALKEWARALKPRCPLWAAVPDIGNIARAITAGGHLRRLRGLIWGGQTYLGNLHYTGWDFETLCEDLRVAGFYNMSRLSPSFAPIRDFSGGTLELEDGTVLATSLNLRGLKTPT